MGTVRGGGRNNTSNIWNLGFFPRQVWFCLGSWAAPCPLLSCDGGPKTERCTGPSSNSSGPWGRRTPRCSLVPLRRSSRPPKNRKDPHHSVSKREGKSVMEPLRPFKGMCLAKRRWPASPPQDCVHCAVFGENKYWNGKESDPLFYNPVHVQSLWIHVLRSHNRHNILPYHFLARRQGGAAVCNSTSVAEKPAQ